MENSSKAVLIVGAILIVLSLVGVAMYIIFKTDILQTEGEKGIKSLALLEHNKKFSKYEGEDISYNTMENCILDIIMNNSKDNTYKVKLNLLGGKFTGTSDIEGKVASKGKINSPTSTIIKSEDIANEKNKSSSIISSSYKDIEQVLYRIKCGYTDGVLDNVYVALFVGYSTTSGVYIGGDVNPQTPTDTDSPMQRGPTILELLP